MQSIRLDPVTVRTAREAAGLSMNKAAKAADVSNSTFTLIESYGQAISEATARKVCAFLRIDAALPDCPTPDQWGNAAQHVRSARTQHGWSADTLAARAGFRSHAPVYRVELAQDIDGFTLEAFRVALDLPPLFWHKPAPPVVAIPRGSFGARDLRRRKRMPVNGNHVRAARVALGLTQKELGAQCGAHESAIRRAEKLGSASEATVAALLAVIDIPDVGTFTPPEEQWPVIGRNVQAARQRRLMARHQLAYKMGVHIETIEAMEVGRHLAGWMIDRARRWLDLPDDLTVEPPPDTGKRNVAQAAPVMQRRVAPEYDQLSKTWFPDAPCRQAPIGLFDPIGEDEDLAVSWVRLNAATRDYCSGCTFLTDCRQAAVSHQLQGIWGAALFRNYQRSGLIEHRQLAELIPLEVQPPPVDDDKSRSCAFCGRSFELNKRGRHRIYCTPRCKNRAGLTRYHRDRQGGTNGYGSNRIGARAHGPMRPVTKAGNGTTSFEQFKSNITLSDLRHYVR